MTPSKFYDGIVRNSVLLRLAKVKGKGMVRNRPRLGNESGQAMAEYVILVILVGLVCIPVARALPEAVAGYVRPFYYCISRPLP